jgi:hypothetical protein
MHILFYKTLLECGYPLLTASPDESSAADGELEPSFAELLDGILQCVKFPRKEVAECSSAVIGLLISAVKAMEESKKGGRDRDRGGVSALPTSEAMSQSLLSKLESKFLLKDGMDSVASCLCAVSKHCPQFLPRQLFLRVMSAFRRLKPRGRYEFLLAVYRSSDMFPADSAVSAASTVSSVSSGPVGVMGYLKPFVSSLLADLSTAVIRLEDTFPEGADTGRIRLPMVQLLCVKLLARHAATLDLELLEQLVQGPQSSQSGDEAGGSAEAGHGLSMVLNEKAVLKVSVNNSAPNCSNLTNQRALQRSYVSF